MPELSRDAVGDAAAFIDPFTGSGMLLAFESAELLAKCIAEHHDVKELAAAYGAEYGRQFARRLNVGSLVRHFAYMPRSASVVITLLSLNRSVREYIARSTRKSAEAKINKS